VEALLGAGTSQSPSKRRAAALRVARKSDKHVPSPEVNQEVPEETDDDNGSDVKIDVENTPHEDANALEEHDTVDEEISAAAEKGKQPLLQGTKADADDSSQVGDLLAHRHANFLSVLHA